MAGYIKYYLVVCMFISSTHIGYTNGIDSLTNAKDVKKFLTKNFRNRVVIFPYKCMDVAQDNRISMWLSMYDTIAVVDPENGKQSLRLIQHELDSSSEMFRDLYSGYGYSFDKIAEDMNKYPYHFYKADIDENGYTDMVIEAGLVVIVMDMGNKLECHALALVPVLKFSNFFPLGDGSAALVFRHEHHVCESTENRLCNKLDTIVYRFNSFTIYNSQPATTGIFKVMYYYANSAAVYQIDRNTCMEINRDGACFVHYGNYDPTFYAKLDAKKLNDLWSLALYLNVKSKRNYYSNWTDHADVIVCEGFAGNVVLKSAESMYNIFAEERNVKDELLDNFNFEIYGGTPILGINKPVIIGHGISHALAFKNMLNVAKRIVNAEMTSLFKQQFAQYVTE